MKIGALGDIVFEITSDPADMGGTSPFANSIDELKRERSWKYAEHDIVKGRGKLQALGGQLASVSFSGKFVDCFCVPLTEINRIVEEAEKGEPLVFVVGDEVFGEFVIEKISETWSETDGNGNPRVIAFDVSLKEYN